MDPMGKDPVCGMIVMPETGFSLAFQGATIQFCSEYCRDKFQQNPKRYLATVVVSGADEAKEKKRAAYFSMEVALDGGIPTYSGGLGVLAGDMLRACADLNVPVVGISRAIARDAPTVASYGATPVVICMRRPCKSLVPMATLQEQIGTIRATHNTGRALFFTNAPRDSVPLITRGGVTVFTEACDLDHKPVYQG